MAESGSPAVSSSQSSVPSLMPCLSSVAGSLSSKGVLFSLLTDDDLSTVISKPNGTQGDFVFSSRPSRLFLPPTISRRAMSYDDVEIEDMEWIEELQALTYPCPCGDLFQITREELRAGEEIARCPSCSLSLTIYTCTRSKALDLEIHGAHIAGSSAKPALYSDVIFTRVSHPADVRSVILDTTAGVLSALPFGAVIVDSTSSDPSLAREISAAARAKGCWAVDAPVSGGDIGARDGKLAIFAGGEEMVVNWLSPILEILGKATWMGPAGSGQSSKIANQIAIGGSLLGLSEALVFVEMSGIDKRAFLEAVGGGAAGSKAMELFGERMIGRELGPGGFAEYMVKDLGMGLDGGGEDEGVVVLPGAALTRQLYLGMVANGDGKMGTQGIITVIERINGKNLE